jgi:hypothetical protein
MAFVNLIEIFNKSLQSLKNTNKPKLMHKLRLFYTFKLSVTNPFKTKNNGSNNFLEILLIKNGIFKNTPNYTKLIFYFGNISGYY